MRRCIAILATYWLGAVLLAFAPMRLTPATAVLAALVLVLRLLTLFVVPAIAVSVVLRPAEATVHARK